MKEEEIFDMLILELVNDYRFLEWSVLCFCYER